MKKTALLLMLALTICLYATIAPGAKPGTDNPDVTGVYQGENTRFLPTTPGENITTREAIFYIWGQSGRHFWGSVISNEQDGNDWQPRGYINGVIQPDSTFYFVNYFADSYNSATKEFSGISPIAVLTNGIFIPASGKTPKMLQTVGLRFNNNETTSGTYIQTNAWTVPDKNPGSPYTPGTN